MKLLNHLERNFFPLDTWSVILLAFWKYVYKECISNFYNSLKMAVLFKEMPMFSCPQRISIGVPSEVVNFFCKGLDNKCFRPLQPRWILSKLLSSTIIAQKQPKTIFNKWKKWMSKVLFPWNLIYKNRGGPDLACGL